jgi:hypothetical protein
VVVVVSVGEVWRCYGVSEAAGHPQLVAAARDSLRPARLHSVESSACPGGPGWANENDCQ